MSLIKIRVARYAVSAAQDQYRHQDGLGSHPARLVVIHAGEHKLVDNRETL